MREDHAQRSRGSSVEKGIFSRIKSEEHKPKSLGSASYMHLWEEGRRGRGWGGAVTATAKSRLHQYASVAVERWLEIPGGCSFSKHLKKTVLLFLRTSMYIPKRKGEAQLSVQHGAPRERCCDPPPTPFCVFGFLLSCVDYRASSVGCSELQYL